MDKVAKEEPKKPYARPEVTVYGTVRELTQRVGAHGQIDHGPQFERTHF